MHITLVAALGLLTHELSCTRCIVVMLLTQRLWTPVSSPSGQQYKLSYWSMGSLNLLRTALQTLLYVRMSYSYTGVEGTFSPQKES